MAKGPTMKFPEPNAERAMQVANYGMDSMREMTEQSLNQSKALFEGILTTTRKTVEISTSKHVKFASARCRLQQRRSRTRSTLHITLFTSGNRRSCSSFRASL